MVHTIGDLSTSVWVRFPQAHGINTWATLSSAHINYHNTSVVLSASLTAPCISGAHIISHSRHRLSGGPTTRGSKSTLTNPLLAQVFFHNGGSPSLLRLLRSLFLICASSVASEVWLEQGLFSQERVDPGCIISSMNRASKTVSAASAVGAYSK